MIESSSELRSRIMRAVRGKNTKPEMIVRRIVWGLGFHYRLHLKNLPGKPDLAFIGRRKAIFVHGCFWHGHDCPRGSRLPKVNKDYWSKKITCNRQRDVDHLMALEKLGWQSTVIWECELKFPEKVAQVLFRFLD